MSDELETVETPVLPEDIDHENAERPLKASEGLAADLARVRREKREANARVTELEKRLTEMERNGLSDLERLKAEKEDLQRMFDEMNAEKARLAADKIRTDLAREFDLPKGFETRIQGEDEESMRTDAETLSKLVAKTSGAPAPGRKAAAVRSTDVKKDPNAALKSFILGETGRG